MSAAPSNELVIRLTEKLEFLAKRHANAAAFERSFMLEGLLSVAEERRAALVGMAAVNPASVLAAGLADQVTETLPEAVRALLEERRVLEGELTVRYVDGVAGQAELQHVLTDRVGKRRLIHFTGPTAGLRTGQLIQSQGIMIPGRQADDAELLVAACCDAGNIEGSSGGAPLPDTTGEQLTLVLLANFQENPDDRPLSLVEAEDLVLGEVSAFFEENAYGQAWLAGDVFGWFTLPLSNTGCQLGAAGDAADQAAAAAGVDVAAYDRIIYLFTRTDCNIAGMGTVGGSPSRSWIDGAFDLRTIAHELGHNFGLRHAHSLDCGDVPLGPLCSGTEYGDTLDVMGSPDDGHFNAFHKERLGWLTHGGSSSITEVTGDGNYVLDVYESGDPGTKSLKIPRGADPSTGQARWYTLEYRQALGFDAYLDERSYRLYRGDVTAGVAVRATTDGDAESSNLLYMKFDSLSYEIRGRADWFDPALAVGSTHTDPITGTSFTLLSADGQQATVAVQMPGGVGCEQAAPGLTVSPAATAPLEPGEIAQYEVILTSQDGIGCSAAYFDLTANVPDGWSASFSNSSPSLGPGESATTTATVTSASTAADGVYEVTVTAQNAATSGETATVTVDHDIAANSGAANEAPVAVADEAVATEGVETTIFVLANDFDPEGDSLQVVGVTQGSKGGVWINSDSSVGYQPGARPKGGDSFSYTVSDGQSLSEATVSIRFAKGAGGGGNGGGGKGRKK